ncbi:MAG: aspartate kinase [Muribaculaceae bacterium]|nr:aspartate kinase [Muribaculaceae bacterium]
MKVLKFGGTSVGTAERIKKVASLIMGRGCNLVVLSAMSGTTNTLVSVSGCLYGNDSRSANDIIDGLRRKYAAIIDELYATDESKHKAVGAIEDCFATITAHFNTPLDERGEKRILAQGELMSTALMYYYLRESGCNVAMIPALEYMRVDANEEPDTLYIKSNLTRLIDENKGADLYLTQGYICLNARGEVDNLRRGGSDYTASLAGCAINAEEVEIWTDIDGMHNNDPRFVPNTRPVNELHFDEAAELAYFGAKILHPTCILPARENNLPVRLLNTMQPEAKGTLIYNTPKTHTIKAVAAKDNITAIKIKSGRMLLAHGFMRKVFEIFDNYRTSVDMVATSEVGVSVTVDNHRYLENIVDDLSKLGDVTVDRDMVIICVVGDLEWQNCGFESRALDALRDVPVRMISYGGSNFNISFLVKKEDKVRALNQLSRHLFG